jgi:hypothetical protein
MNLLTEHYLKLYPDLPHNWRVFSGEIIEDRRRKLKLLKVEGGVSTKEMTGEITVDNVELWQQVWTHEETFILDYQDYQELLIAKEITLEQAA